MVTSASLVVTSALLVYRDVFAASCGQVHQSFEFVALRIGPVRPDPVSHRPPNGRHVMGSSQEHPGQSSFTPTKPDLKYMEEPCGALRSHWKVSIGYRFHKSSEFCLPCTPDFRISIHIITTYYHHPKGGTDRTDRTFHHQAALHRLVPLRQAHRLTGRCLRGEGRSVEAVGRFSVEKACLFSGTACLTVR